jgi:hypothetical protein
MPAILARRWVLIPINVFKEFPMVSAAGHAMENVPPNGHARPVAVVQGGALTVPTLLGRAAPRIPVAGRIRAGIKVLTRRAAENERVRAIYECGVGNGKSFDTIEREIADAAPDLRTL